MGKIYVTSGIAKLLKEDRGVWAAVLGHEIGHTLGQHHYKTYLRAYRLQNQINYCRIQEAKGDKSATWSLLAIQLAGGLAYQNFRATKSTRPTAWG